MFILRRAALRALSTTTSTSSTTFSHTSRSASSISALLHAQSASPSLCQSLRAAGAARCYATESETAEKVRDAAATAAREASEAAESVQERASETLESAREEASDTLEYAREEASEQLEYAREEASEQLEYAREEASEQFENAKESASEAADTASSYAQGAAAAAGLSAIRRTNTYTNSPRGVRQQPTGQVPDPSRQLFFGNLAFEVSELRLEEELTEYGRVTNIKIVKDERNRSKGFGYATFEDVDMATRAMSDLNGRIIEGRRVIANYALQTQKIRDLPPTPPSRSLYIGNLSWDMTDQDLNDLFRDVKNILDVRVAIDRRTGQPRGFAHADFTDLESAAEAMDWLSQQEFYGRRVKADYSTPSRDFNRRMK